MRYTSGSFLSSLTQILLEICFAAITVLCEVVTTIEGTQQRKLLFLTLEYWDFTPPRVRKISCRGLDLLIVVCSNHFAQGYRTSECLTPTLSWKGTIVRVNLKDLPQRSDLHRSKRVAQGRESEIVTKVKFQLRMSPCGGRDFIRRKHWIRLCSLSIPYRYWSWS